MVKRIKNLQKCAKELAIFAISLKNGYIKKAAIKIQKQYNRYRRDQAKSISKTQYYEANIEKSKLHILMRLLCTHMQNQYNTEMMADSIMQMYICALLLIKRSFGGTDKQINQDTISKYSQYLTPLAREIFWLMRPEEISKRNMIYIQQIHNIINNTNFVQFFDQVNIDNNPLIDFYENFLYACNKYDKMKMGIYHTPYVIVSSIVKNINHILQKDFHLSGLDHNNVRVIDFACGIGTFMLSIYDIILTNKVNKQDMIEKHIMKHVHGCEILLPSYCLAYLYLSQHLIQTANYVPKDHEWQYIHLTNTLKDSNIISNICHDDQNEDNNTILVITGNPPYNNSSQNKGTYIENLNAHYIPQDSMKESNRNALQDDYVKFIRFAENAINAHGKGVVGIIANHGFLSNVTFRAMRQSLMNTFDKIYIIDLHGNSIKRDMTKDYLNEESVFTNIRIGVAIVYFIKNHDINDKGIYHLDIFGTREEKYRKINDIDLDASKFTTIKPEMPFFEWFPKDYKQKHIYSTFWNINDIFIKRSHGISTCKDRFTINEQLDELKNHIYDFRSLDTETARQKYQLGVDTSNWKIARSQKNLAIINEECFIDYTYRPFDNRYTYFNGKSNGFHARPGSITASHIFQRENIVLCCSRQFNTIIQEHFLPYFITRHAVDNGLLQVTMTYPLYLYHSDSVVQETPNFQSAFMKMIEQKFGNQTPESILAYIYAIFCSSIYLRTYGSYLKSNYPSIPFEIDISTFSSLSIIGQQLIDLHTMKKIPKTNIGRSHYDHKVVTRIKYNAETQRLYFNDTSYFTDISQAIYDFQIGEYKVLTKYLRYRRGYELNIEHVQNIIKILGLTIERMAAIDAINIHFE